VQENRITFAIETHRHFATVPPLLALGCSPVKLVSARQPPPLEVEDIDALIAQLKSRRLIAPHDHGPPGCRR